MEKSKESPSHYLPHIEVIKVISTTYICHVFDESLKQTKNKLSLNAYLLKGRNVLEQMLSVLMKFRQKTIRIISDIKKAFIQISAHK